MWILVSLLVGCGRPVSSELALEGRLLCDEGEDEILSLSGSALDPTVVDALAEEPRLSWPTLRLEPVSGLAEGSAPLSTRAVTVEIGGAHATWTGAGAVELRVDAALGLAPGSWDVVATRPDGEEVRVSPGLLVSGPPVITGLDPSELCHGALAELTLSGEGLLVVDGVAPTVTVGGLQATVISTVGCSPLAAPGEGEVCEGLVVSVDTSAASFGEAGLSVDNPDPAACSSEQPAVLTVSPPPEISAVSPDAVCRTGGEIVVSGEAFTADMVVTIDGEEVETTFVDENTLLATLGEAEEAGVVDVGVYAAGACEDTLPAALNIAPEPIVFALDPPSVWSGADMEVVAWVSDVIGEITQVWLTDASGAVVDVVWSWDAATPGQVTLTVPAGLEAGAYTLQVVQDERCPARASTPIEVLDETTIALQGADPAYAWTWTWTPVTLTTADPIPTGEVGFEETPRVYLVGEDGSSTRLLSVDLQDEQTLSAIVPDQVPVGTYDVLVVNPSGALGVLTAGLTITEQAPPTVRAVTPASVPHTGGTTLTVLGKDFRDPSVSLSCLEGGVESTLTPTVTDWDYNEITATLTPSGVSQAVCVVAVENADGAATRWSAISITNPSQNLFPWAAGSDLSVARRAPAAASGRTTAVDRYVYAIGGDSGDSSGALSSVEVASVGVYGTMGDWVTLGDALPEPRTLAAAITLGRFVYVLGGNDGASPVQSALRAVILDPLDVPRLEGVSVMTVDEGGLSPGTWTYRVSALYPTSDEANPGGESLPGDPVPITLPDVGLSFSPTLTWTEVEGASGYRIYRSLSADDATLGWVADVDGVSAYTDAGEVADGALTPLEEGALGAWAELAELSVPRESPCAAWGRDPETDPEIVYLYVAGGLDDEGEALDSVEVLAVTVVSDDLQTAGEWETLDVSLSKGRYRCGGFTADDSLHPSVPEGETWVYFAGGETSSRTTGAVDAGRVEIGGGLDDWQTVDSMSPARAGFGYASASDFLYVFGGSQGEASASGASGELGSDDLPEVDNWNSLGTSMSASRLLPGSAQESAVIFILGGVDESGVALSSTDVTNF